MEQFTDDIVEIFSRLPTKSLLRFKCLSKQWRDIIDNDLCLAGMHLIRCAKPSTVLLIPRQSQNSHPSCRLYLSDDFTLADLKIPQNYSLEASCKGLLCFAKNKHLSDGPVILFNPLKQEALTLPPATTLSNPRCFRRYGLGFDAKNNVFKIIRVSVKELSYPQVMGTEILTVGSNSWRAMETVPPIFPRSTFVFVHGAIHWLLMDSYSIVACSVEREEFKSIPLPKLPFVHYLIELDGYLAVADCSHAQHVDIWVLKDYCNRCWAIQYRINNITPLLGFPCNLDVGIIGFCGNDELVFSRTQTNYYSWDAIGDKMKYIGNRPGFNSAERVYHHIITLASLSRYMTN